MRWAAGVSAMLMRRKWWVLALWAAAWDLGHAGKPVGAGWHYFVTGTRVLFSTTGLHLYAAHPELQYGPLTLLVTAPFALGVPVAVGEAAAMAVMSAAGLLVLAQLADLSRVPSRYRDRALILVGLPVMAVWSEVAVQWAHPDDVLAIGFSVLTLRMLRCGLPLTAALLLAAATGCKPWALAFAPLLLLVPKPRWVASAMVFTGAVILTWLPFYLADPGTVTAGRFGIPNSLASSPRVLGEHAASTPSWCRPAQLIGGAGLVLLAIRGQRWPAAILVAVALRLLLDPGTKNYYDAGLLVGTAICDLALLAGPIPWLTLSAFAAFYLPSFLLRGAPGEHGLIRTAYLLLVIGAALLLPPARSAQVRLNASDR